MTVEEYSLQLAAAQLRQADTLNAMAYGAFYQRQAALTKSDGRREVFILKSPTDLIDIDAVEAAVLGKQKHAKYDDLRRIAKRVREYEAMSLEGAKNEEMS